MRKKDTNRFWSKVDKTGNCWNWISAKTKAGYGVLRIDHKNLYAHRLAWEMTNDPIPDGLDICHRCDNPGCVNNNHLFLGTVSDNMLDCKNKGRLFRATGERASGAKLTINQVREIRQLWNGRKWEYGQLKK